MPKLHRSGAALFGSLLLLLASVGTAGAQTPGATATSTSTATLTCMPTHTRTRLSRRSPAGWT